MRNILKQFGGRDTDSFDRRFNRSLIRLTAQYAAALALILIISSTIAYSAFSQRLHNRFQRVGNITIEFVEHFPRPASPTEDDVRSDFVESVILVNGTLLLLGIILSYLLAEKTLEPIKEAYKQQQRFISDASHELRTPISILKLELENELAETNSTKVASKLEEVNRMGKIVNDLLLLSRIDEGRLEYAISEIDVTAIAQDIVQRLQPLAHSHGVTITFDAREEKALVKGNADLLTYALTNVIKNAIVYNKKGGSVAVTVSQDKHTVVTVTDTGKGIPHIELDRIFDRFYRIDESRTRESGGTGLGLAIAQSSLKKMGGSISVESVVDQGTKVKITL